MAKRSKGSGARKGGAGGKETAAQPAAAESTAASGLPASAPPTAAAPAGVTAGAPITGTPSKPPEAREQTPTGAGAAASPSGPPAAADRLIIGWLRDHGVARHAFRSAAEPSYYLKIQTRQGEEVVWGKGLERALATSRTQPQIGDEIGVREIEIRPIALPLTEGGAQRELPQPRTHWVVERSAFFAERAAAARALRDPRTPPREAIREHPDLLGAYFTLDSARKVAEARIGNAESRERFVALVRETLAHAAERGEPLPSARLRAPAVAPARTASRQSPATSYGRTR
jgi:hypothetical protein